MIVSTGKDEVILNLLVLLLETTGYEVSKIKDPIVAIETIKNCHPELIILDVSLPRSTYLDICHEIRNNDKIKDIPIIILDTDINQLATWNCAKIDKFMLKPFSVLELNNTVFDLIGDNPMSLNNDPGLFPQKKSGCDRHKV